MLVVGGGLTVLQYVTARSSFAYADTASRYLVGVYLCTPLIAEPLCRGIQRLWLWSRRHTYKDANPAHPRLSSWLAAGAAAMLLAATLLGVANALRESSDRTHFGVPAGERDIQVLAFLEAHSATRFYTTWWICYRLMFDSQEQADCYVVPDGDIFASGLNRVPAYAHLVTATLHPAYVFDLTTPEIERSQLQRLDALLKAHDPRFSGYTTATVAGYRVYYFAGHSP